MVSHWPLQSGSSHEILWRNHPQRLDNWLNHSLLSLGIHDGQRRRPKPMVLGSFILDSFLTLGARSTLAA